MSRREWRCRNPECPVPYGQVLGQVTADGGLVLAVTAGFAAYLDTRRITVRCPNCGRAREFQGRFVRWP